MARSPLLEAVVDEVDQAIAALQTARRFLRDMERESPPPPSREAPARRSSASQPSLRFGGITVSETAQILGMSEDHVRRLLRAGELEGAAYSGRIGWRLDPDYVKAVAEQRRESSERQRRARQQPGRRGARRRPPNR
jgi:excisionase family DNA binding protein